MFVQEINHCNCNPSLFTDKEISSIFGVTYREPISLLKQLSREEICEASFLMNVAGGRSISFSKYECVSMHEPDPMKPVYQSLSESPAYRCLWECVSRGYMECGSNCLPFYGYPFHMSSNPDCIPGAVSLRCNDRLPLLIRDGCQYLSGDNINRAFYFPDDWGYFCESSYASSSDPQSFRSLLGFIVDVNEVVSGIERIIKNRVKIFNEIGQGIIPTPLIFIWMKIGMLVYYFSTLKVKIRKSVYYSIAALLLQLKGSFPLESSLLIPKLVEGEREFMVGLSLASLLMNFTTLRQTILKLVSIGNFVSLEELMEMFEERGSCASEISMVKFHLRIKYTKLIAIRRLKIEKLLEKIERNNKGEFGGMHLTENYIDRAYRSVEKLKGEIHEMESFLGGFSYEESSV